MSASERELEKAREYRARFTGEKAEFKRAQFSKGVEDSIAEASKFVSFYDIETGGLKPDSPIYEMGFMHLENGEARFSQHFVNPTEIHTKNPGRIDQWSLDKINSRGADFGDILASSNISQKQAPGIAYREMRGRDVVIQNMRFEREALNARTGPAIFDSAARGMRLESFSSGQGLFPTNMAVKERVAEATRLGNTGNLGSYLNAWEDVFTKGIAPMFTERKEGVTRALDLMDLTKSVFAMAQKRNLMGNAGELFTGVSVGAFSKAMYGIDEAHIANMDNVLQGEMFHNFMGAGHAMARGEELPDEMKKFFKNMTDMVPEQKQRNTVKNIIETFRNQQAFLASEASGKPDWNLLEGSRITANMTEANIPVNVLNDAGQYEKATITSPMRQRLTPQGDRGHYSTDINQVVKHWEERAKGSHGIKADYQAALAEARATFIDPYQKALAASKAQGLSGGAAITSALDASKPELTKALSSLESKAWTSAPPPVPETGGIKNFIKNNWKIGLVGAGALFAYNMISGKDDEYNYIEGMHHGGISGGSEIPGRPSSNTSGNIIHGLPESGAAKANRFANTDGQFASPWLGLRNLVVDAVTESSEQYALFNARRRNQERQEEKRERRDYPEGLNPSFEGDLATIDIDNFAVEDADTIRMFMANGESTSIRLAGIDAPEIQHEQDDGSRIWPDQPYGQAAKSRLQEILAQQSNLRAVIDPQATETYGRPVGMLIGDQGQNINLQLVREGAAASLPFGKRSTQITNATEFNRAEQDAAAAQEGMWSTDAWQIARQMQMNSKRKITNVTYTDLGRLFSNFKASSILARMQNPEAEFSEMQASGDRSDFNTIEGLKHGWVGANRKTNLGDFGSGYQIDTSKIPRMPTSYRSKKRVIEGQYLANTQLRQSMKRENVVKHYRG